MTTTQLDAQPPALPSPRKLAVTTALAAAAAAVILVTLVLPAEYNIDPFHTGRALGLTQIAAPPLPSDAPRPAGAQTLAPSQIGPIGVYPESYRVDSTQIVLGPYDYVEYKYQLEQGATMVYSCKSTAGLIHDFHGEAPGRANEPVSYEKKNGREAAGTLTAPFAGIHGWYWENPGAEPVTITLTTAGFYSAATEFRSDRTHHAHAVGLPGAPPSVQPTPPAGR